MRNKRVKWRNAFLSGSWWYCGPDMAAETSGDI
jgi:hypothetical protein